MILFAYGHQSLQVIHHVILWIVLSRMVVQRDSFPGSPTQSFFLSLWFSQRVHRQPKALDAPTSGLAIRRQCGMLPERQHQFRVARNPSRVDATRGDHFLQPTSQDESRHRGRIASGLPTNNSEVDPPLRTEGVVIMLWTITYRSSATDVRDNDHPGP